MSHVTYKGSRTRVVLITRTHISTTWYLLSLPPLSGGSVLVTAQETAARSTVQDTKTKNLKGIASFIVGKFLVSYTSVSDLLLVTHG